MQNRQLGHSDLQVSSLCLGGNVFGWTADEPTSFRVLDAFLDAGGNFVDTADVYSIWVPGNKGGDSETVIGKWFKRSGKRKDVILATKVGMEMAPGKKGLSKAHIQQSVEDSLRRLQTDYIDLYQAHKDDEQTPLEEALGAFSDLINQGKVRAIGASNYSAQRLRVALDISGKHGFSRFESLQPEYNLYDRSGYEAELEAVCRESELGVIPYFSLAAGFLTGKYRSEADLRDKPRGGKVKNYLNDRGFRILAALDQTAKEIGSKPAQVALAWLMARPSITAPIASATNQEQLKDLVAAADLKLERAAIERLDQASEYSTAAAQSSSS
jgi:aryl-alcohol dehydrogenase-like predicted oxidoreductase